MPANPASIHVFSLPADLVGSRLIGKVDSRFDNGYFITVRVDQHEFRGVIFEDSYANVGPPLVRGMGPPISVLNRPHDSPSPLNGGFTHLSHSPGSGSSTGSAQNVPYKECPSCHRKIGCTGGNFKSHLKKCNPALIPSMIPPSKSEKLDLRSSSSPSCDSGPNARAGQLARGRGQFAHFLEDPARTLSNVA